VQAEEIMKHTYSVLPIYEQIIDAVLKFGICKLSEVCSFKLGVPVGPMLAKPTTGVSEVLNKFQDMDFTHVNTSMMERGLRFSLSFPH
jgi:DNA ligase-1